MKRLLLAVLPLVLLVSACAAGDPKPTTYISDTGATLNADIYSSVAGDTEYWWRYGTTTAYGSETPHRTVAIADEEPHPVSEPVAGLTASTTYHVQLCTRDDEESPPRTNCQTDHSFDTKPAGGFSGIAFSDTADIWRMKADGSEKLKLDDDASGFDGGPVWSPDGTRIAWDATRDDGYGDVFVMDADGGNQFNLTDAPDSADFDPAWSPDGSKIAFWSNRDDDLEIYVADADGANQTRLTVSAGVDFDPSWSPDGRKIAFTTRRDGGNDEIYVMNADGTNPVRITDNSFTDNEPDWSPDGRHIAFVSGRDGDWEIYLMKADGTEQTRVTNIPGQDGEPTWSPDGSRLAFYSDRDPDPDAGHSKYSIVTTDPDGSDLVDLTPAMTGWGPDWSPRP